LICCLSPDKCQSTPTKHDGRAELFAVAELLVKDCSQERRKDDEAAEDISQHSHDNNILHMHTYTSYAFAVNFISSNVFSFSAGIQHGRWLLLCLSLASSLPPSKRLYFTQRMSVCLSIQLSVSNFT